MPKDHAILEIGSGPYGVGEFYRHRFVGCDTSFSEPPKTRMLPVVSHGMQLPFADSSFDVVIVSDVLEHVPPVRRRSLILEALRVMRKVAILGFPCGPLAFDLDRQLFAEYQRLRQVPPPWLEEHMLHPFPDQGLFEDLEGEWVVRSLGNENLYFHAWMMRKEMSPTWNRFFCLLLTLASGIVEHALGYADREPCYRRIFVITRAPERALDRSIHE